MHARFSALFLISTASLIAPVHADCTNDIRNMYERIGDIGGVSYESVTEIAGNVVLEHRGWHQDYRHNMSELVGRNSWFMVYGDTSWQSTDGKTWSKADF